MIPDLDELRRAQLRLGTRVVEFVWEKACQQFDHVDVAVVMFDPLDGVGVDYEAQIHPDGTEAKTYDDGRFVVEISAAERLELFRWFLQHDVDVSQFLHHFDEPGRFPVIVIAHGGTTMTSLEKP